MRCCNTHTHTNNAQIRSLTQTNARARSLSLFRPLHHSLSLSPYLPLSLHTSSVPPSPIYALSLTHIIARPTQAALCGLRGPAEPLRSASPPPERHPRTCPGVCVCLCLPSCVFVCFCERHPRTCPSECALVRACQRHPRTCASECPRCVSAYLLVCTCLHERHSRTCLVQLEREHGGPCDRGRCRWGDDDEGNAHRRFVACCLRQVRSGNPKP